MLETYPETVCGGGGQLFVQYLELVCKFDTIQNFLKLFY